MKSPNDYEIAQTDREIRQEKARYGWGAVMWGFGFGVAVGIAINQVGRFRSGRSGSWSAYLLVVGVVGAMTLIAADWELLHLRKCVHSGTDALHTSISAKHVWKSLWQVDMERLGRSARITIARYLKTLIRAASAPAQVQSGRDSGKTKRLMWPGAPAKQYANPKSGVPRFSLLLARAGPNSKNKILCRPRGTRLSFSPAHPPLKRWVISFRTRGAGVASN